jgi:hypothetical protein
VDNALFGFALVYKEKHNAEDHGTFAAFEPLYPP